MSDSVWYYAQGEQEKGPITTVQIKALAGAGKLHQDDFVWKEGMENWVPASQVSGLFKEKAGAETTSKSELPTIETESRSGTLPRPVDSDRIDEPTRRICRIIFAFGLLMAVFSRGCDTLGDRNVARREAIAEAGRREFQKEWDDKQFNVQSEQQKLQAKPSRSNVENQRLQQLTAELSRLDVERSDQEQALETGLWRENDLASLQAAADDRAWGYWRQATLLFATVLLTLSLLGVAYSSDGPERWISYVLLVVIVYSLFASDSVWSRL